MILVGTHSRRLYDPRKTLRIINADLNLKSINNVVGLILWNIELHSENWVKEWLSLNTKERWLSGTSSETRYDKDWAIFWDFRFSWNCVFSLFKHIFKLAADDNFMDVQHWLSSIIIIKKERIGSTLKCYYILQTRFPNCNNIQFI